MSKQATINGFTYYSYTFRWERRFGYIWTYRTIEEKPLKKSTKKDSAK